MCRRVAFLRSFLSLLITYRLTHAESIHAHIIHESLEESRKYMTFTHTHPNPTWTKQLKFIVYVKWVLHNLFLTHLNLMKYNNVVRIFLFISRGVNDLNRRGRYDNQLLIHYSYCPNCLTFGQKSFQRAARIQDNSSWTRTENLVSPKSISSYTTGRRWECRCKKTDTDNTNFKFY